MKYNENYLIIDERNLDVIKKEVEGWTIGNHATLSIPYKLEVRETADTRYALFDFGVFVSSAQAEILDEILKFCRDNNIDYATQEESYWQNDQEFEYFFDRDEETGEMNHDRFDELKLVRKEELVNENPNKKHGKDAR